MRPDHVFIDQWHPWMTMYVSQYGLSDRMRSYVQVYRYDRVRLCSGLRRGLAVVWRYRREARRITGQWRAAHGELSSWARWTRILGLNPSVQLKSLRPQAPIPDVTDIVRCHSPEQARRD